MAATKNKVSPALERIVRHCLEKNPSERFQSARDVAFNLEALTDISSSSRVDARLNSEGPASGRWLVPLLGALLSLASWAAIYGLAHRGAIANPSFHEITFRNGTIWDARFAPDGQTIIYGAAWEGQPQELFSTRADSSDSRVLGLPSAQILSISSTGELAICLHPAPYTHFIQSGTLARLPLGGGAPREVSENVAWADWAPDGQSMAVIRRGKSDLSNISSLEYPGGNLIYEPQGWVSHVRFSPSGKFLAVADHIAAGDDGRVVIVDTHGNHKASSSYYSSVEGLAWRADGKEVWFSAIPNGSAQAIYALDFSGKERLIYRAPGGLKIHDIGRAGLVLLTSDKSRVGIFSLAPGETRERSLSWFDWSAIMDMSADGRTVLFSESGEAVGTNPSIFLRKTDGSPAVRLGDGRSGALSPDGKTVVVSVGIPAKVMLLPTGVGEPRELTDDKVDHSRVAWLPDGRSVLFTAAEPGHGRRTYILDLQGGAPRPLTPENRLGFLVSPDGKYLVAVDTQRQRWLYPIAGGEPQKFSPNVTFEEGVEAYLPDGKSVLARNRALPAKITRVDIATGQRSLWKELEPADAAGVQSISNMKFSADGKSYAYSVFRVVSDLYVVDGLK